MSRVPLGDINVSEVDKHELLHVFPSAILVS